MGERRKKKRRRQNWANLRVALSQKSRVQKKKRARKSAKRRGGEVHPSSLPYPFQCKEEKKEEKKRMATGPGWLMLNGACTNGLYKEKKRKDPRCTHVGP